MDTHNAGTDRQAAAQSVLTMWIELVGSACGVSIYNSGGWTHDGHMEPTAELLTFPESSDTLSLCPRDQGPRAHGPGLSAQGCTWPPRDLKYARVRSGFPPCRLAKLTSICQYKTLEPPAF